MGSIMTGLRHRLGFTIALGITLGAVLNPEARAQSGEARAELRLAQAAPVPQGGGPRAAAGTPAGAAVAGGEVRRNPKDGLDYAWIPPGSFDMGCSRPGDARCFAAENPQHRVTFSRGFWIGKTEATVAAFKTFSKAKGLSLPEGNDKGDAQPAVNMSWKEARDFCEWSGGRLPTEAEWECAARGGTSGESYGVLTEVAWYDDNSESTLHPVATKRANVWGLHDMLGNAWEWVADWYDGSYYAQSPASDPGGPSSGQRRTLRGGSWNVSSLAVRSSHRNSLDPANRGLNLGFRCTRDAVP